VSAIVDLVAQAIAGGHLRAITIELPTPEAAAEQLALFAAQAVHPVTVHDMHAVGDEDGARWWQGAATVMAGPRRLSVTVTTPVIAAPMAEVA